VKGSFHFFPDGARTLETARCLPLLLERRSSFGWWDSILFTRCRIMSLTARTDYISLVVRWGVNNALAASFLFAHDHVAGADGLRVAGAVPVGLLCRAAVYSGMPVAWNTGWRGGGAWNWINLAFFRLNAVISVVFVVVTLTEIASPIFNGNVEFFFFAKRAACATFMRKSPRGGASRRRRPCAFLRTGKKKKRT